MKDRRRVRNGATSSIEPAEHTQPGRLAAIVLALLIWLMPFGALAQQFPTTFAPNTLYGRLGGVVSGPGAAIPISVLQQYIYGTNVGQNTVYAGPASGGSGGSSFRSLVTADLPYQVDGTSLLISSGILKVGNTSQTFGTLYGGSATNSALVLQTTSNGSPSGDSMVLKQGGNSTLTLANGAVSIVAAANSSPALLVQGQNPSAGGGELLFRAYDSGLAANGQLLFTLGRDESSYDRMTWAFNYVGLNSNSNNMWFGFFGADHILNVFANGSVGIGTGSSTPSGALQVVGSVVATSYNLVNQLMSTTAPTFTSGACGGSISSNNGTAIFTISTGSSSCSSTVVIGLPTATTGWSCDAVDTADGAGSSHCHDASVEDVRDAHARKRGQLTGREQLQHRANLSGEVHELLRHLMTAFFREAINAT